MQQRLAHAAPMAMPTGPELIRELDKEQAALDNLLKLRDRVKARAGAQLTPSESSRRPPRRRRDAGRGDQGEAPEIRAARCRQRHPRRYAAVDSRRLGGGSAVRARGEGDDAEGPRPRLLAVRSSARRDLLFHSQVHSGSIADHVSNWGDVRDTLRGTRYEKYLDD